jgi:alkylhydroperoxidase family enzyme
MTWIRTIPVDVAEGELLDFIQRQRALYPAEYATSAFPTLAPGASIVESHSLIPSALFHAFATFGALMDPTLPLSRRQHEMIATTVSSLNRCHY